MIDLFLISNKKEFIMAALKNNVARIFIDLEINGKFERQGHLNTHITDHDISDVIKARLLIDSMPDISSKLLVRINPFHEGTDAEIEAVISAGADYIMLPMIKKIDDVEFVTKKIKGRSRFIPLIETVYSFMNLENIINIEGVDEIYIGLNDLHLEYNLKFMFEPLANGMLDKAAELLSKRGIPFGFGGIARAGEGVLPGELVLAEHLRLGSSMVILSRTFMWSFLEKSTLESSLKSELEKLRFFEEKLEKRDAKAIQNDKEKCYKIINEFIRAKNEKNI